MECRINTYNKESIYYLENFYRFVDCSGNEVFNKWLNLNLSLTIAQKLLSKTLKVELMAKHLHICIILTSHKRFVFIFSSYQGLNLSNLSKFLMLYNITINNGLNFALKLNYIIWWLTNNFQIQSLKLKISLK